MDLSIAEGKLTLHVRGADKLWAFKSSLEIPLVHIASVRTDPEVARGWYHGIRMPGTNPPCSSVCLVACYPAVRRALPAHSAAICGF